MPRPARRRARRRGRGRQAGGTITVLSAGDVDHIDPGQAYYSFTYEISYADPAAALVVPAEPINAIPDLASAMPKVLERRQDGHRAHPPGRSLQPPGQPRGDLRRREVRDRARVRVERGERLRRRLLRRRGRRAGEGHEGRPEHQRHPDAEQAHDRVRAQAARRRLHRLTRAADDRARSRGSTRTSTTTRRPRRTGCTRSRPGRT